MAFVDEETAKQYREAFDAWLKQLEHVHRVFLDGERIGPDQIKGLLNRESRAKAKYDEARDRLLGLDSGLAGQPGTGDNPFR